MTPELAAGRPSADDLDAAEALKTNEGERLTIVRKRAEKWLAGLTALTGLLTAVLVVKGPASIADLDSRWRNAIGALVALALVALIFATLLSYLSAHGNPGRLDEILPTPVTGLAERLLTARRSAAAHAQRQFVTALGATLIGIALLAGAVGLSWFAPAGRSPSSRVCLLQNGTAIAELSAGATVRMTQDGTTIGLCPKTS